MTFLCRIVTFVVLISMAVGCRAHRSTTRSASESLPMTNQTYELMRKRIDLNASKILYAEPMTAEHFQRDWTAHNAEWSVQDGWLTGKNPENAPGMAILNAPFPGNVMVEFDARTVLPSTHDIDVMWNGEWLTDENKRGTAYVAGVEGWWTGKVGLEKSPEYKLTATTPLFDFEPGHIYRILAGSIDGHLFVFVDGRLLLEVTDPDPIDSQRFNKVGFEAYASHIQVRHIVIRQIAWQPVEMKYGPETGDARSGRDQPDASRVR